MKILFVCTCLEPGLDGVGDYSWRLASALQAAGHACSLLALADTHVQASAYSDRAPTPDSGNRPGISLPCLRLPATAAWPGRGAEARRFVESVAPDWISWQFVLYGFDPRGLAFGLGARLRKIARGYRSQIMFHEIWIGEARQSTLKHKLIGHLQKRIVRDVVRQLQPAVVHTHTPLYQHLLGKLGCPTTRLTLFGNIPVTSHPQSNWLKEKWPEIWTKFTGTERKSWWIFLMFGSLHPEWDADDFLRRASAAAALSGKKCALLSIGRQGAAGERRWQVLEQRERDGLAWEFRNLGAQPEGEISQCLLTADFGVSAMPPEYLFKSGTAAAMIEHGLPVIATRPTYEYRGCPAEILATRMRNIVTDFELADLQKSKVGSLLPGVAAQFIEDLQQAGSSPLRA